MHIHRVNVHWDFAISTNIKKKNITSTLEVPIKPPSNYNAPLPQKKKLSWFLTLLICFTYFWILFKIDQTVCILLCPAFCVHHRICFTHLTVSSRTSFIFIRYFIIWKYHNLFIHSTGGKRLVVSTSLAIENTSAMNIFICLFWCTHVHISVWYTHNFVLFIYLYPKLFPKVL